MFKVKNRVLRLMLSAGLAGLVVFHDNFGMPFLRKAKEGIKKDLTKRLKPYNKKALHRYMPKVPMNQRPVSSVVDLKLKEGQWYEGRWYMEEHDASHLHNDFSIVVNGRVYRMARTPSDSNKKKGFLGLFPGPEEKASWRLQYEHYPTEVPNSPVIDDGYGKGKTKVVEKGECLVKLSPNGNLDVVFEKVDGAYSFIEKGQDCLVIRKFREGPGIGKHKMRVGENTELQAYCDDPNYIFVAKYEGSAVDWEVVKHTDGYKYLRVYSYRPDKKLLKKYGVENQIDHTYKLSICDKPVHKLTPICKGRGEIWIGGRMPMLKNNSVLNSGNFVGRQSEYNKQIKLIVHDITYHEDIKVTGISYLDKLDTISSLSECDKRFVTPKAAFTTKEKEKLWRKLKADPAFDGVVAWNINDPEERATKIKFKHEKDYYHQGFIARLEPQKGKDSNKFAYPIIENEDGVQFKCGGIGVTHELKADMYKNPDKYIGRKVYYSAEHHFDETGKPFQPVLKEIL